MTSDLIMEKLEKLEKLFIVGNEEDMIEFKINKFSLNRDINDTSSSTLKNFILASQKNIKIRNLSKEYISFRVQTTKKANYIIKPCYFIISPNDIINIEILFYINPEEKINSKGHKFQFEGFIISKEEKDKGAKKLFFDYISQGKKVKGAIVKKYASFIEEKNILYNNDIDLEDEYDEEKKLNEFEDLKVEYCKLKGINENLRMEYFNIKKIMEMELKEKNNKCIQFMQFKYDIDFYNNNQTISTNIFIICFIISILIGFFLIL